MDEDKYVMEAENSFVYFLILLAELHLSKRVNALLTSSNMDLNKFILRNKRFLRRPSGILVL